MTTTAIGGIAALLIYAMLELIISLLLNGTVWIAGEILNETITVFDAGANVFQLPFIRDTLGFFDLSPIVRAVSIGLILVNLVTSVLRSIVSPMSGENAEHPLQVLFRSLAAIALIHLFFGIHWSMLESDGLIAYLGRLFGTVLSSLSDEVRLLAGLGYSGGSSVGLLKRHIAVIILLGGLMSNVIGAAVTYVERFITFIIYVWLGPVFLALYANRETSESAKQWVIGIFTQFAAIFISLLLWIVFLKNLSRLSALGTEESIFANNPTFIFDIAVCMAVLSLVRTSEQILNAIGLRTIPNGDTLRMVGSGIGILTTGIGAAISMGTRVGNSPAAKQADTSAWERLGERESGGLSGFMAGNGWRRQERDGRILLNNELPGWQFRDSLRPKPMQSGSAAGNSLPGGSDQNLPTGLASSYESGLPVSARAQALYDGSYINKTDIPGGTSLSGFTLNPDGERSSVRMVSSSDGTHVISNKALQNGSRISFSASSVSETGTNTGFQSDTNGDVMTAMSVGDLLEVTPSGRHVYSVHSGDAGLNDPTVQANTESINEIMRMELPPESPGYLSAEDYESLRTSMQSGGKDAAAVGRILRGEEPDPWAEV